jgi:hypothetical protein
MARIEEAQIRKARVLRPVGDFADDVSQDALCERLERYWASASMCLVVNWQNITRVKALVLVAMRTTEEQVASPGRCVRHCGLSDAHKQMLLYIRRKRDLSNVFETEQEAIDSCVGSE